MAPNLKNVTLLNESLLTAELEAFRRTKLNFASTPALNLAPSTEDYWGWPSDAVAPKEDVLSLEHIEDNLVAVPVAELVGSSASNPGSDAYWAESHQAVPQHYGSNTVQQVKYWDEPSHAISQIDLYWAMTSTTVVHDKQRRPAQHDSDYWCERSHSLSDSDRYWASNDFAWEQEKPR